jgi:geranylgeranyl diphosphate synthase type II
MTPKKARSEFVETKLRHYGALTKKVLKPYLGDGEPRGYLYDLVSDYPSRVGKMMRPSLCLANARVFGGTIAEALPTAVAIELLHNALLIHDDIEDGSKSRRGRPALHQLHGIPLALNAGDLLLLTSLRPLLDNRHSIGMDLTIRLFEEAVRMARESAEGQALELGWRERANSTIGEADYLKMVLKKTCWLAAIFPMRAGALIATRGKFDLEPFIRFGFFLGAAFQVQDDLLNLAPTKRYGKEANGDLLEGKRTLILIDLLRQAAVHERAELRRILSLSRAERTARQVTWMLKLIEKYDCIEFARDVARQLAGAALHEFSQIYAGLPDSEDRRFIEELSLWTIERE